MSSASSHTYHIDHTKTSIFSLLKHKFSHSPRSNDTDLRQRSIVSDSTSTFSSDSTFISSFSSFKHKIKARLGRRRSSNSSSTISEQRSSTLSRQETIQTRPQSCTFQNSSHRSSLALQASEDRAREQSVAEERRRSSARRMLNWSTADRTRRNGMERTRGDQEAEDRARRDSEIVYYVQFGM